MVLPAANSPECHVSRLNQLSNVKVWITPSARNGVKCWASCFMVVVFALVSSECASKTATPTDWGHAEQVVNGISIDTITTLKNITDPNYQPVVLPSVLIGHAKPITNKAANQGYSESKHYLLIDIHSTGFLVCAFVIALALVFWVLVAIELVFWRIMDFIDQNSQKRAV